MRIMGINNNTNLSARKNLAFEGWRVDADLCSGCKKCKEVAPDVFVFSKNHEGGLVPKIDQAAAEANPDGVFAASLDCDGAAIIEE